MPINYEIDPEYKTQEEENQDKRDATISKAESLNKKNIMDFDDFIAKEGIDGAVHSKNRK